ncbi:MAG TPA: hypothetical protein VFE06_08795 [Acidobacteriaceae bacterium]|jgi:hypothetical protein|nr:hypothetical protein [Acidobacteriaceae bacterium]
MRTLAASAILGFAALAAAQNPSTYVQDHRLAAGGTVNLTINVGDVKLLPDSSSDRLRLEIHTKRPVDQETMAGWVKRFELAADRATIDIQIPKWKDNCADDCGGDVTLYVPQHTNVKADLEVGDMTISGILGDKDVHIGVGDLRIAVANPSEYGHVETHARIGDVHDFLNRGNDNDGFLGKSEDFTLSGQYHLKASTGIGDVHISRDGKS